MELTEETKRHIDGMPYAQMLRLWRSAPAGSSYFVRGPVFDYFDASMKAKLAGLAPGEHTAASKAIG